MGLFSNTVSYLFRSDRNQVYHKDASHSRHVMAVQHFMFLLYGQVTAKCEYFYMNNAVMFSIIYQSINLYICAFCKFLMINFEDQDCRVKAFYRFKTLYCNFFGSVQFQNKMHVLVPWGCYNRIPETEWLINNRSLVLTVLEAQKSKIMPPEDFVSVPSENLLPGSQISTFLFRPYMAEGVRKLSGAYFIRALILFMRVSTS